MVGALILVMRSVLSLPTSDPASRARPLGVADAVSMVTVRDEEAELVVPAALITRAVSV